MLFPDPLGRAKTIRSGLFATPFLLGVRLYVFFVAVGIQLVYTLSFTDSSVTCFLSQVVVVPWSLFVTGLSFAPELDTTRVPVKEKGATWIAGETSVSNPYAATNSPLVHYKKS